MKILTGALALVCVATALGQLRGGFGSVPGSSNVRFQTVAQGTDATGNAAGLLVFSDPTSWSSYWHDNHRSSPPMLERGFFDSWRLVAIHAGTRPSEGYGLGVIGISRRIDRATISAIETVPPRRDGNEGRGRSNATSPWIVLRVEKGAFGLDLQTQQVRGYSQTGYAGTSTKIGGATVTFGPGGYGYCPPK